MVHQAMGNVGVTRKYQDIETKAAGIPFVGKSLGLDLDQYVSSKALDGLFSCLKKRKKRFARILPQGLRIFLKRSLAEINERVQFHTRIIETAQHA